MSNGLQVRIKARVSEESTGKLVNALDDIFSPVSESFGLVGDAFRLARIDVATKVVKRAKQIADANGWRLKAPPLKFLAPFMDAASLEQPDDKALIEMWARLLADSGSEFQSRHMILMRVLREITSTEAKLVRDMCQKAKGDPRYIGGFGYEDAAYAFSRERVSKFLTEWLSKPRTRRSIVSDFILQHEYPGTYVSTAGLYRGTPNEWPYVPVEGHELSKLRLLERKYPYGSFDLLVGLSIIHLFDSGPVWVGDTMFEVRAYHLTNLGGELAFLCLGQPKP